MSREMQFSPDLKSLDDAMRILRRLRRELAPGSLTVWKIVDHACNHLERQIHEEIREDAPQYLESNDKQTDRPMYLV